MVGLDVTHKALFTQAHIDRLDGRVGEMVTELLRFYGTFHRTIYNFEGSPIHDALAVAHVLEPDLVGTLERNVEIDTESELCRGRTVVDLWQRTGREPNAHVGVEVDSERFLSCDRAHQLDRVTLVFGAIAPHGTLPEAPVRGARDAQALAELGRRFEAAAPEATIVLSPHNVHVEGHFAVVLAGTLSGSLAEFDAPEVTLVVPRRRRARDPGDRRAP